MLALLIRILDPFSLPISVILVLVAFVIVVSPYPRKVNWREVN
jgi:hypothetical protein